MKIANLVLRVSEHIAPDMAQARPETELVKINPNDSANMPIDPLGPMLRDLMWVEAALRAQDQGCEAAIINSVCDYGLPLLRSAVSIPVLGCGQASVLAAMERVDRFSFVTVWPAKAKVWYDRILDLYGATERCASMRFVLDEQQMAIDNPVQTHMKSLEEEGSDLAEQVLRSCRDAVKNDGAQAIILGCTCMVGLVAYLRANVDAEIIDPLHEALKAAENAALAARGKPRPTPICSERSLDRVREIGRAMTMASVSMESGETECGDVCAIAGAAPQAA